MNFGSRYRNYTVDRFLSFSIDGNPGHCYNKATISDTRHHADADRSHGLTGVCFSFQKRAIMLGKEKKRIDVNIQRSEKQWHGDS